MPEPEDTNKKPELNSDSVDGTSASQPAPQITNNMAIYSLLLSFPIPVLSIILTPSRNASKMAIYLLVLSLSFPVISIFLAVRALGEIKRSKQFGRGLAIAAIVVSIVFIIVMLRLLLTIIMTPEQIQPLQPRRPPTQTTQTTGKIPDGFPKDIPVYPGSTIKFANISGNDRYVLSLSSTDTIAKVNEYYLSELKANGWVADENNLRKDPMTSYVGFFDKGINTLQLETTTGGGIVAVIIYVDN